jgi:predicted RNase H-like HicB family nuclease
MPHTRRFTAIIEREEDAYVAHSLELDIASQGATVEEARTNLIEAIELFFETASPDEIRAGTHYELFVTSVEVTVS